MKKFLLVEDSPLIVKIIKHVCKSDPNLQCDTAGSFSEARDLIDAHGKDHYLVAVVDLNLPDAGNGEVVDYTLQLGMPTIVLTGNFDDSLREQMLNKKIVDYVIKESRFSYEYVVKLIKRMHNNQNIRILVTDDSKVSRNHIASQLKIQQFDVVTADDGDTALDMINQDPSIKLLITDYNMPRMNGFDLVKSIRKEVSKNDLVIIGLSGEGDSKLSAKFIKNGANDFLTKPFSHEEFHCRIMHNIENMEYMLTMKHMAYHDYITGLPNKRKFYETGHTAVVDAQKSQAQVSLALLSIDNLHQLQDQYGLDASDRILVNLADLLPKAFERFTYARVSDAEIGILMIGLNEQQSSKLVESFRLLVEDHIVLMDGLSFNFSISAGVVSNAGASLQELLKTADNRLYRARDEGGNQVFSKD